MIKSRGSAYSQSPSIGPPGLSVDACGALVRNLPNESLMATVDAPKHYATLYSGLRLEDEYLSGLLEEGD